MKPLSRHRKEAGFTLVELLTVLVIIGLMASAVVITLPREKPAIYAQTTNLISMMNGASQNSLITGRPHAWGLSKDGFAVFDFVDGVWVRRQGFDRPANVEMELKTNKTRVKLSDEIVPLVVFEPTGMSTPFELTLSDGERREILTSGGDGRVVLERDL